MQKAKAAARAPGFNERRLKLQSRSEFLTGGALAFLAPAAIAASPGGGTPSPSPSPSPQPSLPPLHFDLAAFDTMLNVAAPHRHLFASTKLESAVVLAGMRNTLNAYHDIGITLTEVRPVAVLYHGLSVTLGFDDTMWNEYFIPIFAPKGKHVTGDDATKDFDTVYDAKKRGNPCLHKQGGREDTSIESLVADAGARFFICNNATEGFAHYVARHLNKSAVDVYANLVAHLVQNATLVPAGVWAVHAIQERRYTVEQCSL
jgi:hypothetical protein